MKLYHASGQLAVLSACLVLGCSQAPPVARMPNGFPRLPSAASYQNVWAEGRFYTDHDKLFGTNLLQIGVVPVALRIFLRSDTTTGDDSRVLVEDMRPELYLPDGTRLSLVSYDRIEASRDVEDRITEEALDINVIKPEAQSEEGFVFFQLPEDGFEIVDTETLIHRKSPLSQELRISDGLIALEYFTNEGARPIYVGLRKDRGAGRR